MSLIPRAIANEIILQAGSRCEYCGLSQLGQEATFHIDHILPKSLGGPSTIENLALACVSCSLRKGAKHKAIDPETGELVNLFNPRTDVWSTHFQWDKVRIVPLTAVGRATVSALGMNRPLILEIREEEIIRGRHHKEN